MFPPALTLASQSPRRRQILEALGLPFRIQLPDAEETTPVASDIEAGILRNSGAKARSVLSKLEVAQDIIVAADTLVVQNDEVLGKPAGKEEARRMLQRLSGKPHFVITGLTLLSGTHGTFQVADRTWVHFRKLGAEEIEAYLATHEPYDKAGSYAIQGVASLFVEKIEGSYTNVMGLPVEAMLRGLAQLCGRPIFDWFAKAGSR